MIFALPLKAILDVENPPSSNCLGKKFLKPSGSKNLWLSGKIWVENRSTCFKNTTQSLKDGDLPSKFMQFLLESKSFNKLWNVIQTS